MHPEGNSRSVRGSNNSRGQGRGRRPLFHRSPYQQLLRLRDRHPNRPATPELVMVSPMQSYRWWQRSLALTLLFSCPKPFQVLGTPTLRAGNGFPRSACMTRVPPHVPAPSAGYHVLLVRTIALIGLKPVRRHNLRLRCRR